MTPDQWRVIFYIQVLKGYRDVLSADYKLHKERYKAQVAEIRAADSDSDAAAEDENRDLLEEGEDEVETIPQSIDEIDKALEQLQAELESSLPELEPYEEEEVQEPVAISYLSPAEDVETGEFTSPPIAELSSVKKAESQPELDILSSSKSVSPSPGQDVVSSKSLSIRTSFKSITPLESSDEEIEQVAETSRSQLPPSPPTPLFPHIIVLGKTELNIVGLGVIRLKEKFPLMAQIDEYCITDFTKIQRMPKIQTLPKKDTEIYARTIRHPQRPKHPVYSRPESQQCNPSASKLQTRIKVEPYPNMEEIKVIPRPQTSHGSRSPHSTS